MESQRQVSRILRQNLLKIQDLTEESELSQWVKPFISEVFDLCSNTECLVFKQINQYTKNNNPLVINNSTKSHKATK